MKVLFLTESYYPKPSPNAICVGKLINVLSLKGAETHLITLKNVHRQQDKERFDNLSVYRINNNLGTRLIYYCQSKKWNQTHLIFRLVLFLNKLNGALLGFWWPLLAPFSVLTYYRVAKKIHKKEKIDVVIGVYKQIEAVLAGVLLKKKYPEIKFIIYTLDAISGSILPTILNNKTIALKSTKRWERILFRYADSICVMESHKEHYSRKEYDEYRSKIKFMDIPLIEINSDEKVKGLKKTEEIKMVFTGSMHHTTADPRYFLQLLHALIKADIKVSFYVYGNISDEIKDILVSDDLYEKRIFICGRVSHEEIVNIQKNADILLNFGNSYPCTIPCKIFEYISVKKPILSFYKIENDASKPYLVKYPRALLLEEKDNKIEENANLLKLFIDSISNDDFINDIEQLYYSNTPYPMVKEILNING